MKSTPAMRDRIRELSNGERDDYDRAVLCVLDDLEALIAAIPQWQPIDTAPRDATKIDVWLEHKHDPEKSFRMPNAFWSPPNSAWKWDGQWGGRVGPNWTVTHWMPRPAAPKVES